MRVYTCLQVFIQKAAVNLLSSVLDTPEFFWRAPDSFQALYERICEYLELEERVEVLNARFSVSFSEAGLFAAIRTAWG